MRAILVQAEPERRLVLADDVEEPVVAPGEVLVEVRAVALNRGEVFTAFESTLHGSRIGTDFAGVVLAAPEDGDLRAGDRVAGLMGGLAWAERIAVPRGFLAKVPAELSFEAAAAVPVAGLTAKLALGYAGELKTKRVLITAANGGVGLIAVQLAAQAGAEVTAMVRSEASAAALTKLGAAKVAVGLEAAAQSARYDVIFESVGGQVLGQALEWLASRGICLMVGNAGGAMTTFDADRFRMGDGGAFGGATLFGFFLREERLTRPIVEPLQALLDAVAAGKLDPMVGATGSWSEAHTLAKGLLARAYDGKAVMTLD